MKAFRNIAFRSSSVASSTVFDLARMSLILFIFSSGKGNISSVWRACFFAHASVPTSSEIVSFGIAFRYSARSSSSTGR